MPDRFEAGAPHVFTIPPGAPFLETLSDALLDGRLVDGFSRAVGPLGLATATLYVPTRRSARALGATLASRLGTASALLPRIVPLGALDDTELLFEEAGLGNDVSSNLPIALGPIARRMILTRLILGWGEAVRHAIVAVEPDGQRSLRSEEPLLVATSPADAWHLSGELSTLIDELVIEEVAWTRIEPLGTDDFDRYWRITLDFLDVAITQYPQILAAMERVDAATRQMRLIEAEVQRLTSGTIDGPMIVAGSTGTNKATARLIAAVSRLPQGAVVLPGLDQGLDEESWRLIGASIGEETAAGHPQAALHRLLEEIGVTRAAVQGLGRPAPNLVARGRLVSEALRPAATTDRWRHAGLDAMEALRGVTLVEAADENEEACAIAIALRETLEGHGTAALVTPDRELARRVREELTRWNIDIEESSGEPLGQTPAGALARLVLDCALKELAPVEILALLHHPDLRLGRPRGDVIRLARHLELGVLRGILPAQVLRDPEALLAAARARRDLPHAPAALRLIGAEDFAEMGHFLADLLGALKPLRDLPTSAPLPAWLQAHERVLAALARDETGDVSLDGADFSVLGSLFEELDEAADPAILLDCPGYGALFDRLAAETPVRGPNRSHPRIKILGLLEARLLTADRLILGGLDETIWPPAARSDPFLNRPMRSALGLSPPERRIARTAHDFEMALGQEEVIVTRALKRGGAPTVPSRFLQRLGAVAPKDWAACRSPWRPLPRLCARPRPPGGPHHHPASCPAPARGAAAREAQRHPHRDAAARPLRDLCRAHPEAHAAGAPGGPDGPTRVRNELPCRDPRLQPEPCRSGPAAGCGGPSARPHPRSLRRSVRRPGVPHVPVASHPQLVAGLSRMGDRAAHGSRCSSSSRKKADCRSPSRTDRSSP